MRVFVIGATGVLGRALLPPLVAAGHEVVGLAHSAEKLPRVENLGARPVCGDILDSEGMRRLVREIQPEGIVNLATAIPLKLRVDPKDWALNERIRLEGTANLLAAAQESEIRLFVQESAGYIYEPGGDAWLTEETPPSSHPFRRHIAQMEAMIRDSGIPATLLRFGALNAADAWHTQQAISECKRGMLPIIGDGSAFMSQIHAEDAAQAICRALADPQATAGQTFNVVDNEPARMREVFPYIAQMLSAPPPRHVPPLLAKMLAGALTIEVFTASYRISSAKIRQALGFAPRFPTYRESWAAILQSPLR